MAKNKALVNVFSSGMQAIGVQVLGGVFFYFISVYVSKDDFGIISWANAVVLFLTTFLSSGFDQVVVRRIAASNRSDWAAAAYFLHAVFGFVVVFLLLFILSGFIKNEAIVYKELPLFFLAQGLLFIASPFKLFLNAKERFTPYGIIVIVSNCGKIIAAYLLFTQHKLYLNSIITVLIASSVFELCSLLIYIITCTDFSFKVRFSAYGKLVKESLAQYLSVIFDMSLSRMDWILLGIMTTNVVLADYSFAYRAFELARLPMLIIAPIILPKFARLAAFNKTDNVYIQSVNAFNTFEMFFVMLIPLALNILWAPLLTLITNGKYGNSNSLQFLILSLCIPLQLFINLLWSMSFSAKKYRSVTTITIICAITNIVLNLALISLFKGLGAAIAFFTTTLLQSILYYVLVYKQIMIISLRPLLTFATAAAVIYLTVIRIDTHFSFRLLIAVALYVLFALVSRQLNKQHLLGFKHFLSK